MNSDKEKIISEEDDQNDLAKIPKTQVIKKTVQKPCFLQGLGVTLGVIALIVSLAALIALMGWKIVTPPEIAKEPVVPEPREDPNDLSFCKLPKAPGDCKGMMPKWYFDSEFDNGKGRCLKFVYSGCNGNRNNFETQRDCEHTCLRNERDYLIPPKDEIVIDVVTRSPPVITDPCELKPDVGNCEDSVPRYYYDVETNSCKIFLYGGCRGNANNFLSLENCLARCQKIPIPDDNIPRAISDAPEFCEQDPETGTCRGSMERWYYDKKSGLCKQFEYGGCDGNKNNFETQDQCEKICQFEKPPQQEIKVDEVCNLEADIGPCRASMPRYFFNSKSGKCELFTYGGCSGNRNNFESASECEKKCLIGKLYY